MDQTVGVLIALAPSSLVGSAAVASQYLAGYADSITLAILRWDTGFFLALPVTLLLRAKWPQWSDWPRVVTWAYVSSAFSLYSRSHIAIG